MIEYQLRYVPLMCARFFRYMHCINVIRNNTSGSNQQQTRTSQTTWGLETQGWLHSYRALCWAFCENCNKLLGAMKVGKKLCNYHALINLLIYNSGFQIFWTPRFLLPLSTSDTPSQNQESSPTPTLSSLINMQEKQFTINVLIVTVYTWNCKVIL
jgi:hypothetical protein